MVNLLEFINQHEAMIKGYRLSYEEYHNKNIQKSEKEENNKKKLTTLKEIEHEDNDFLKNFQINKSVIEKFTKHPDLIIPNEKTFKHELHLSPNLIKPKAIKKSEPKMFNET